MTELKPAGQHEEEWSEHADAITQLAVSSTRAGTGGHDLLSAYVERFWLPILGPSTTWLLRLLAHRLERDGEGVVLEVHEVARSLGLSGRPGRRAPFPRALRRAEDFGLLSARLASDGTVLAVGLQRHIPTLSGRLLDRLPSSLLAEHRQLFPSLRPLEGALRHADQLAATLVALGEEDEDVVRQLIAWRIAPGVARASARRARQGLPTARAPQAESPCALGVSGTT